MDPAAPNTPSVPPVKTGTSGLAIASLICGLGSFLLSIITGIPAIIMGHIAMSKIKKSQGTIGGHGVALAGTILGYVSIALIPIIAILAGLATPAILKAKKNADKAQLINQVKMVGFELNEQFYESNAYPASPGELPLLKNHYKGDWYYFPATNENALGSQPILVSPISDVGFVYLRVDGSVATKKEPEFQATIQQGQGEPVVIPPTYQSK